MIRLSRYYLAALIAAAVITAGCARREDETTKKLEETQKQLDEAKKQLASANQQAPGVAGQAADASRTDAPPASHTLAAGTPIVVRTLGAVSTKTSESGSIFEATLAQPLVVDGYTVAPKGASVEGVVTNADDGGRVKGLASITVGLRSVAMGDGRRLPVKTSAVSRIAKKSGKKDAVKVGIASGIGAAIGAIAGGGKGAAIGAGAGAAGGSGVVLATRGDPATIPAETVLTFKLSAPATFQELRR